MISVLRLKIAGARSCYWKRNPADCHRTGSTRRLSTLGEAGKTARVGTIMVDLSRLVKDLISKSLAAMQRVEREFERSVVRQISSTDPSTPQKMKSRAPGKITESYFALAEGTGAAGGLPSRIET